jgi:hypothetical protein
MHTSVPLRGADGPKCLRWRFGVGLKSVAKAAKLAIYMFGSVRFIWSLQGFRQRRLHRFWSRPTRSDGGQCEPPSRVKISNALIQLEEKQERHRAQMVQHVVSKTGDVEEPRLNNSDFRRGSASDKWPNTSL